MAKIEFTPHQLQAAQARGGSLLVSAAAGSGKTAVLTERVIRLLTGENPVPADRLIIVTYTVAAADEMRRRIGNRLSELIEEDPSSELLQNQQLLLENAHISTIHSLCSGLIKDNAQKLGLSGELRIVEEADLAVMKNQAVEESFERHYAARDADFLSLMEFTSVKDDKALAGILLSVYDFIRSFAFPLDFLGRALAMYEQAGEMDASPWAETAARHAADAMEYCEALLERCIAEMEEDEALRDKYLPAFRSDLEQYARIRSLAAEGRLGEAAEAAALFQKLSLGQVRKHPDPELKERMKACRDKAYSIFSGARSRCLGFTQKEFAADMAVLTPQTAALFRLVREVYAVIERKKQEQDVLDYSDLEHYALELLTEKLPEGGYGPSGLARELSEQFDEIMVDECQDINEVQNTIFTLLSRRETNLFLVGDVKQSIYRFRQAMPELFLRRKKAYPPYDPAQTGPGEPSSIRLETNFRSRKEVCGIVNFVFSRLMSEEMGEIDYNAEEALIAGAAYPEADAAPELHIVDTSGEEDSAAEARYLAALIGKMVREGYPVAGKEGMRPCTFRDFAILLRSQKKKAGLYAEELEKQGIPAFCESSDGYFDSYEVAVALNFLRVIDNPLLDVPLLSVLLSPIFAFSPDKAAQLRLNRKDAPLYLSLLELAGKGDPACAGFAGLLGTLRRKAASLRVDALIQEIYDRTDFIALSSAMGEGGQKDANLRLLLTYAGRYEANGTGGLSGFLRYLDRILESRQDFSCANISSERADCVRVMSIHKSKGLEFPICIVADCGKAFNKQDLNSRCQMNAALGFSMKINEPETLKSYTSLPFEAIRLRTEKETISEEMRVLYVAMTRAKEKLILLMGMKNAQKRLRSLADLRGGDAPSPFEVFQAQSFGDWLLSALLSHPGMAELRKQIGRGDIPSVPADFELRCYLGEAPAPEETAEKVLEFRAEAPPELLSRLEKSIGFRYPFEPLTHVPAKLTPTTIAKQTQKESIHLNVRPGFLREQGLTPAQRGTVLHSFMQYADFAAAEADLDGEISRLVEEAFLTKEEAQALNRKKIQAFLSSPLYGRMKNAHCLREYKFLYFVPAGETDPTLSAGFADEKILIQGIADCLIFEPDGITIVDYKTDYSNRPDELAARYRDQLRVYRDAVGKAFPQPVKQCLLYSLHMEREIEIVSDGEK